MFCRQMLFCVADGVHSSKVFSLQLVSLTSKYFTVSFWFLLRLLTRLLLRLTRPIAVEQNLKKQVFGSGNKVIVKRGG